MRRVVMVLALLALALPMAAWADTITFDNQFGTVSMSNAGISSKGLELLEVAFLPGTTITAGPGHALGSISYSTGALLTGSLATGGTFSSTGSTFDITGMGTWAKELTGSKGPVSLFAGSFEGTIDWTFDGKSGQKSFYTLSGEIVVPSITVALSLDTRPRTLRSSMRIRDNKVSATPPWVVQACRCRNPVSSVCWEQALSVSRACSVASS